MSDAPSDGETVPNSAEAVAEAADVHASVDGEAGDMAEVVELPPDSRSKEELAEALFLTTAERDSYLETAQRVQAEFDNFRKRSATDADTRVKNGVARIAEALLPVLDAFDAAVGQGEDNVEPLRTQLYSVLEREGLSRVGSAGEQFDPNVHEAVLHEAGDGGESVVAEELRCGYLWHGRVLRAAMVKVRN